MMTRVDDPAGFSDDRPVAPKAVWHERQFSAMNTIVHLSYYGNNAGWTDYVESRFEQSEERLSRFRPTSELARLNGSASAQCHISADLFNLLETVLWAVRATDGLFDPAILDDLERAGYDRSFELIDGLSDDNPLPRERPTMAERPTIHEVKLDATTRSVGRPARLRLDLGGIGKGWTVDRCADLLHTGGPFLLNAGGDLYAYGAPGSASGWEIEIEDALRPDACIGKLAISNVAVATSTRVKRRWQQGGQRLHHIIDPRSGLPAETDLLAATVVASRVTSAEVYAKCALILGSRQGLAFLEQRGVDGLLQAENGTLYATPGLAAQLKLESPDRRIYEGGNDEESDR